MQKFLYLLEQQHLKNSCCCLSFLSIVQGGSFLGLKLQIFRRDFALLLDGVVCLNLVD